MASTNKPGTAGGSGGIPVPPTGRLSHAPRQSTATQIRLKVIQGSVERLMGEVEELGEIKQFLVTLRNQMDQETAAISIMNDIAFESLCYEVLMPDFEFEETPKGNFNMLELEPAPKIEIKEEVVEVEIVTKKEENEDADSDAESVCNNIEEWNGSQQ